MNSSPNIVSLKLRNANNAGGPQSSISFTLSPFAKDADIPRMQLVEASLQARRGLNQLRGTPSTLGTITTVANLSSDTVDATQSFVDVWGSVLGKLELFTKVADRVSEVRFLYYHPDSQPLIYNSRR